MSRECLVVSTEFQEKKQTVSSLLILGVPGFLTMAQTYLKMSKISKDVVNIFWSKSLENGRRKDSFDFSFLLPSS